MTEKDIEIWNECVSELSPEGQQDADVFLRDVTKKLKAHTDEYNEKRGVTPNSGKNITGVGRAGAKELIIALIKAGYL